VAGYVRERKVLRLRFDDPDMDGLVVRARTLSLGEFLDVVGLRNLDPQRMARDDLDKLFGLFAQALLDWNLEEPQGTPVPVSLEGLHSQDADFVLTIIGAWVDGMAQVSGPLGAASSNGRPSPEASLPMEARSPSPTS
jgi:hypothetical protein